MIKIDKKISILLIFIFLSSFHVMAEETLQLLLITRANTDEASSYAELSESIYTELLAHQGIEVVSSGNVLTEMSTHENQLEQARNQAMVFYAVNTLTVEGESITIDAEFRYTVDDSLIFESSASGSINLGLERKIEFIVSQAADLVALEIENRGREVVEEAQKTLEEEKEILEMPSTVEVTSEEPEPEEDQPLVVEPPQKTKPLWAVGLYGTGTFPIDTSADYFDLGGRLIIDGTINFPFAWATLSTGIRSGVGYAQASGSARDANSLMINLGPTVLLRFRSIEKLWGPYLGISGGAGFLGLEDSGQWLWKIIPWLGFSLGADFFRSRPFSLWVGMDGNFFFEQSLLLFFLEPTIGARFSW